MWTPTVANFITLGRVLALVPLAYCWFAAGQLTALVVFVLVAASDLVDGWLSRLLGQESEWGKKMDPVADKVFVYGTTLMLVPQLWLYLLLIVAVIALRDADVERLRMDNPYRAPHVPTIGSAKAKTLLFMVGLGCVMADGSLLDQLPVSAMMLAYASFLGSLVCALYSWVCYHELFRTVANDRF